MRRIYRWAALGAGLFFAPAKAAANTEPDQVDRIVREIRWEGLRNFREKEGRKVLTLKRGKPFSAAAADESLSKLMGLEIFAEAAYRTEEAPPDKKGRPRVDVVFEVSERPLLTQVEFEGNRKISDGKLRKEIRSRKKKGYDPRKASDDASRIAGLYRQKGYAEVQVEPRVRLTTETHQAVLLFFIQEGPRIAVGEVRPEGNEALEADKIRRKMKTRKGKVLLEEVLQRDLEAVAEFYRDEGFLDVKVGSATTEVMEDPTKIRIRFPVEEGPRYRVGEIRVEGAEVIPPEKIRKMVELEPGEWFRQSRYDRTLAAIQMEYAKLGYLRARIRPEKIRGEASVASLPEAPLDIVFHIREGGQVFVNRIYIDGNTKTKDRVIRCKIYLREGDVLNIDKLRRSQERLVNTGFFANVGAEIEDTPQPDRADIAVEVEETRTGILSLGAGFSAVDKFSLFGQVQEINFLGRGQNLSASLQVGGRVQNYTLSFTEPHFRSCGTSLGFDLFRLTRFVPVGDDDQAYRQRRVGGAVRVGRILSDFWSLGWTYSLERERIFDVRRAAQDAGVLDRTSYISSLATRLTRDSRDNVFDPGRGSLNTLSLEIAGGPFFGDFNFTVTELKSSWWVPTFWRFVFGANFQSGYAKEYGPPDKAIVPETRRFLLGGQDSIRGYDWRSVGPLGIGGRFFLQWNAEHKLALVKQGPHTLISWAVFADFGGAWLDVDRVNFTVGKNPDQLKLGVGTGIRLQPAPVFPIRLDWGYGFQAPVGEKSQFYFTVGQLF